MKTFRITVEETVMKEYTVQAETEEAARNQLVNKEFANEPQHRLWSNNNIKKVEQIGKDPEDMQDVGI